MSETTEKKTLSTEEFTKLIGDTIDQKMREAGMDEVDRKHAMFGTQEDPNGESLKELPKEERIAKFFSAVVADDKNIAKALSEGTAADGGYLVPTEFRASVITKLYKESEFRRVATTIPMRRDKMDVPAEGNAVTVAWKAENAALTESNPTFGTLQLDTNKLTGLSKMSRELFADSAIGILDYLSTVWARSFAQEEDRVFTVGTGTGQPKGLNQYSITSVTAASTLADTAIALFYALPVQYRRRASFAMHNSAFATLRGEKDGGATGGYVWTERLADAAPTILGRPVIELNDLPTNLGTGTDESEIYIGDFSYYLIGDREEMGVETTTVGAGAFENHQVAFKAWERIDGKLGLTDAFRKSQMVVG